MLNDRVHAAFRQLHSRWLIAAASVLIATGLLFTLLSNLHALMSWFDRSSHRPVPVSAMSQTSSGNDDNALIELPIPSHVERNYAMRTELLHKVQVAGHRRDRLEEVRQRLLRGSVKAPGEGALSTTTSNVATEHNVREELTSALIRLLTLEKNHTDKSPEIISIRKQITQLQARMASSPPNPSLVRKLPVVPLLSDYKAQLEKTNKQIILSNQEITGYLKQLLQLASSSSQVEDPQSHTARGIDDAVATHIPLASNQLSGSESGGPITSAGVMRPGSSMLIRGGISGVLGLLIAIAALVFYGSEDPLIRDEAKLKSVLPATVEYVGSIPRMKTS